MGVSSHLFELISLKQHVKFLNANYTQFPAHHPRPAEPRLEVHPDDAADLGLVEGAVVRVHNERGALMISVTGTEGWLPFRKAPRFRRCGSAQYEVPGSATDLI